MVVLSLITAHDMPSISCPQYYIYIQFKEHSNCFSMHTPSQSHHYNRMLQYILLSSEITSIGSLQQRFCYIIYDLSYK